MMNVLGLALLAVWMVFVAAGALVATVGFLLVAYEGLYWCYARLVREWAWLFKQE